LSHESEITVRTESAVLLIVAVLLSVANYKPRGEGEEERNTKFIEIKATQ
jgi:hypothetical protein